MSISHRRLSLWDRLLSEVDHKLKTVTVAQPACQRPNPARNIDEAELSESEKKHVAGLMRVNHTGEVCAQALYRGQALMSKDSDTQAHLLQAAEEEQDHLVWCQQRLDELESRPSLLNFFWYSASFKIGAIAGLIGDKWSYGFVVETEKQVEQHLTDHLGKLPKQDQKSRAILEQMRDDEVEHGQAAQQRGAQKLPHPIRCLMRLQSKVMTTTAYRV